MIKSGLSPSSYKVLPLWEELSIFIACGEIELASLPQYFYKLLCTLDHLWKGISFSLTVYTSVRFCSQTPLQMFWTQRGSGLSSKTFTWYKTLTLCDDVDGLASCYDKSSTLSSFLFSNSFPVTFYLLVQVCFLFRLYTHTTSFFIKSAVVFHVRSILYQRVYQLYWYYKLNGCLFCFSIYLFFNERSLCFHTIIYQLCSPSDIFNLWNVSGVEVFNSGVCAWSLLIYEWWFNAHSATY